MRVHALLGFTAFAPTEPARGSTFSARYRAKRDARATELDDPAPYAGSDIY